MSEQQQPDWLNAETCIENAEIAYDDSIEDEDGPVDTVVSSGDLGVLIGLARHALGHRLASRTDVIDPQPEIAGDPLCKIVAYNQMHETAVELGYPSVTEALEHLDELRSDSRIGGEVEIIRELIGTYEELIEHLGDDMGDSRRTRIEQLEALSTQEPTRDARELAERIAAILGADPVCCGRVTMDSIEQIAALSASPRDAMREALEQLARAVELHCPATDGDEIGGDLGTALTCALDALSASPVDDGLERLREDLGRLLSAARAQNPHDAFGDEAPVWNDGFCAAWETVRAKLNPPVAVDGEGRG